MIDPSDVTKYDRTVEELEEFLSFCVCVPGHNAKTTAKHLDSFFRYTHDFEPKTEGLQPFKSIDKFDLEEIRYHLKCHGIGSHGLRSRAFYYLVNAGLDLRTCTREDLVKVPGIGLKTASYFILHSREGVKMACLDRHVRRWLKSKGHIINVEKNPTPKVYMQEEQWFMKYSEELNMTCADLDLLCWNESTKAVTTNILGIHE